MLRPHPLAWKIFWWLLIALRIWIQMLTVNFKIRHDQTPALPHKASSHSTSACLLTNLHLDCSPLVHSIPSFWDAFSVLPIPHPHPSFHICLLLTSSSIHSRITASEKPYLFSLTTASPPVMSLHDTTYLPFVALNNGNNFTSIFVFITLSLSSLLNHTFHKQYLDHVCFCSLFKKIPGTYLVLNKSVWNK